MCNAKKSMLFVHIPKIFCVHVQVLMHVGLLYLEKLDTKIETLFYHCDQILYSLLFLVATACHKSIVIELFINISNIPPESSYKMGSWICIVAILIVCVKDHEIS